VLQAQSGGRKVGVITLGRGESKDKVKEWLKSSAKIPGIIGFAVGRTIFWEPLANFKANKFSRKQFRWGDCSELRWVYGVVARKNAKVRWRKNDFPKIFISLSNSHYYSRSSSAALHIGKGDPIRLTKLSWLFKGNIRPNWSGWEQSSAVKGQRTTHQPSVMPRNRNR